MAEFFVLGVEEDGEEGKEGGEVLHKYLVGLKTREENISFDHSHSDNFTIILLYITVMREYVYNILYSWITWWMYMQLYFNLYCQIHEHVFGSS